MHWRIVITASIAVFLLMGSVVIPITQPKPRYIRNFEINELNTDTPFVEPHSIKNGLAVYTAGRGKPVLLFPYPHSHTRVQMVQEPLSELLVESGRMVVTFDVPGAYLSTRVPV